MEALTSFRDRVRAYGRERPATVALMAAAVIARLVFWLATDRVWEDSLITVTHARNAALGLGLVHHLGEGRVHGFTSALSVLIPLAGELVHGGAGILALRLASIVASVVAIGFADALARDLGLRRGPTLFALAYLAFERNQIFYGMTGMETEVAVAVLLGSVLALVRKKTVAGGVGVGLSLLARPDFVLWVGPALAATAREDWRRALRTLAIAAAVVAPWILFTTLYYGSPVPHTILAKAGVSPAIPTFHGSDLGAWVRWGWGRAVLHRFDWAGFAPFLSDGFLGGTPVPLPALETIALVFVGLGLAGMVATARGPWAWRAASVYLVAFHAYRVALIAIIYYEWYFPPFMALFALEAAAGMTLLARKLPRFVDALALVLGIAFAAPLPFVIAIEGRIEREIETPVRREIGLFLHERVKPGDAVVCEPAGYIGYYGEVLLYDWPGLTSPAVRQALATLPREERTLQRTIALLKPRWVVLRPDELDRFVTGYASTAAHYRLVRTFEVSPDHARLEWHGLVRDEFDWRYHVLERRADP